MKNNRGTSPIRLLKLSPSIISYLGYCFIFSIGALQPRKLEEAVQVAGNFIFSIIGGVDNRLLYSLTLLFVFVILELARNFPAFYFLKLRPDTDDLSSTKSIKSDPRLFLLLIVLYYVATVVSVMRSTTQQPNWQPIPDLATFFIDFVMIWAVAYSIVNFLYLSITAISLKIRR